MYDFDDKGILSTLQCRGWAKRKTIKPILFLESIVKKAPANDENVAYVFFYMGVAGRIFNFIQNFLKHRYFKVEFKEVLSDTKNQTVDFPQGSVVILFFYNHK